MLPVFDETYVNGGQLFYSMQNSVRNCCHTDFFNRFAFRNI